MMDTWQGYANQAAHAAAAQTYADAIAEGYEVDEAEELALAAAEDAYQEYGGHDEA